MKERTFTASEMVREVESEILMRHRVYPNRVAQGKMTAASASRKISIMQAVLAVLQQVDADEQPSLFG